MHRPERDLLKRMSVHIIRHARELLMIEYNDAGT